jgi:hypothetical protein
MRPGLAYMPGMGVTWDILVVSFYGVSGQPPYQNCIGTFPGIQV